MASESVVKRQSAIRLPRGVHSASTLDRLALNDLNAISTKLKVGWDMKLADTTTHEVGQRLCRFGECHKRFEKSGWRMGLTKIIAHNWSVLEAIRRQAHEAIRRYWQAAMVLHMV
jgi:hypothetical protein